MRSKCCLLPLGVLGCVLAYGGAAQAEPLVGPSISVQTGPTIPESKTATQSKTALAPKTTLEKVRSQGFVQCGSAARPGLAMVDAKGSWTGLELEICRAVATAVFGSKARYAYHKYESARDYDSPRAGDDQISFLTQTEMDDQKLTGKVAPGPVVFVESHDLLVSVDAPFQRLGDLAGHGICMMIASAENHSVDAWYLERKIDIVPHGYQEDGEMWDTYNVQRCEAVTGESTALAAGRLDGGINHLKSRLLAEHLLSFPVLATTSVKDDAQWAAIVAWTIDTLLNADAHETNYRPDGLRAMSIAGEEIGLAKDWQKTVIEQVGSYSAIFRRTLGADSPLKLDQGLNKPLADGGILLAPFKQ